MVMSRARDKITKALAAKGYSVWSMEYLPPGIHLEKEGQEGGWEIQIDPYPPSPRHPGITTAADDMIYGWNIGEALANIAELPQAEPDEDDAAE